MKMDRSPTERQARLEWLLENALAALRAREPECPDMQSCWLFSHGADLLGKPDWDSFEWRYDGS